MTLRLEIQSKAVSIAQIKENKVIVHDEHLLVDQDMVMRLNGRKVDFFFGDDVKKKTRAKEIVVKALDLVDAIRFAYSSQATGNYAWESVTEPFNLKKLCFHVYTVPPLEGQVLERVTYDGMRPDEISEACGNDFAVVKTIPVTDAIFSRHPLLME